MPIVFVGAIMAAMFASMLSFCLLTGTPCPVDGFDEAARASAATTTRMTVACILSVILSVAIAVYSGLYLRRKWEHPHVAMVVTVVFVFMFVMLWGISASGNPIDRQVLIFASLQFLVAGLIVFAPLVSVCYFVVTFYLFGLMAAMFGEMPEGLPHDLVYLAILDIVVCWVVYGLFARATGREHEALDIARRDELTGAKNRHCLRYDFPSLQGVELFVMLCDIDDFKHYNDDFSHEVGDYLLREFYFALREAFGDECVYRYGGDEFLVVSPDLDPEAFGKKVDKAAAQLAEIRIEGRDAELSYTGGYVCGASSSNAVFRAMLHRADENLLEAKRAGKNRVVGG